jgi:hypothetical protein
MKRLLGNSFRSWLATVMLSASVGQDGPVAVSVHFASGSQSISTPAQQHVQPQNSSNVSVFCEFKVQTHIFILLGGKLMSQKAVHGNAVMQSTMHQTSNCS